MLHKNKEFLLKISDQAFHRFFIWGLFYLAFTAAAPVVLPFLMENSPRTSAKNTGQGLGYLGLLMFILPMGILTLPWATIFEPLGLIRHDHTNLLPIPIPTLLGGSLLIVFYSVCLFVLRFVSRQLIRYCIPTNAQIERNNDLRRESE